MKTQLIMQYASNLCLTEDFMSFQYLANTDETPASMGGKENYWRKLTLDGEYL